MGSTSFWKQDISFSWEFSNHSWSIDKRGWESFVGGRVILGMYLTELYCIPDSESGIHFTSIPGSSVLLISIPESRIITIPNPSSCVFTIQKPLHSRFRLRDTYFEWNQNKWNRKYTAWEYRPTHGSKKPANPVVNQTLSLQLTPLFQITHSMISLTFVRRPGFNRASIKRGTSVTWNYLKNQ